MPIPPVLIVGAGPTGMTAALDLAHYSIPSVLFDEDHTLSEGSRAIAYSAATLAVWEKLGAAQAMLAKGVPWSVRHTYFGLHELFTQNFPIPGPGFLPRFFNLQQYYVERFLLDQIERNPLIDLRLDHKVTGLRQGAGTAVLQVATPQGEQEFSGSYILACDGARSTLRKLLNLDFPGTTHLDHFLIADVRVDLKAPPEPRFYFDHPTNPGQTTLIHPQPDGVWRMDWQVGADVDIQVERDPQRMDRRIRSLIGNLPYEIVWLSDYRFHQRLLKQFRHGQVFFLGDSAHLVAPFGARGLNSAIADVENLVWKLVFVLKYGAPESLLNTYQAERWPAQQHNQVVTDTTMRFMSPPNPWRRMLRDMTLRLSRFYPPARRKVDSGKFPEPFTYSKSPLITADDAPESAWQGAPPLGGMPADVSCAVWSGGECRQTFFRTLIGSGFVVLYFSGAAEEGQVLQVAGCNRLSGLHIQAYTVLRQSPQAPLQGLALVDESGSMHQAFAAQPGTFYLLRPDGHICARRRAAPPDIGAMICKACGLG